jgi:RNA polymerase sigma-70 factor (ECF subfamily)
VADSERELMKRIADGDEAAFASLYAAYATRLYRFALVRCGRPDLAEDAVQETLLVAWRSAAGFRGEAALITWLFGICHNVLSHLLRRLRETLTSAMVASADGPLGESAEPPAGDDPWGATDLRLNLGEALARLDEGQRTTVFLVYYQDQTIASAAGILGIPEGTVKSRLHHARQRLQAHLAEQEVRDSAMD